MDYKQLLGKTASAIRAALGERDNAARRVQEAADLVLHIQAAAILAEARAELAKAEKALPALEKAKGQTLAAFDELHAAVEVERLAGRLGRAGASAADLETLAERERGARDERDAARAAWRETQQLAAELPLLVDILETIKPPDTPTLAVLVEHLK